MSKLVITDSLVERVAQDLYSRNAESAPELFSPDTSSESLDKWWQTFRSLNYLVGTQPSLAAFFLASTAELAKESQAVGIFLSEVIFETFRSAGRTTRPIDVDKFLAAFKAYREIAIQTEFMHETLIPQHVLNSVTLHQPALLHYLTTVLGSGHKTCPHNMPYEEVGFLFAVLKSIVDVLDEDSEVLAGQN